MNPLDAREAEEYGPDGYEPTVRPYVLPTMPRQAFRVLAQTGDQPVTSWTPEAESPNPLLTKLYDREDMTLEVWSDKYLTAEDAKYLRQDGV